jgi:hypothetical protein
LSQGIIKTAFTRTGPQFLEEKKILLLGQNLLLLTEKASVRNEEYYFEVRKKSMQQVLGKGQASCIR